MAWIDDLYSKITDFRQVVGTKLNYLYDTKEDKVNKKTNLTSADPNHYPNVPAVRQGINTAIADAISQLDLDLDTRYIKLTEKASNGGVATLDSTGKIPANQLPSFVDDVIDLVDIVTTNPTSGMVPGQKWYNSTTKMIFTAITSTTGQQSTPITDVIYVNTKDSTVWRWTGTSMVQLQGGLVLGTTATTAYRGDHGLIAYQHSQVQGNPHNTQIGDIPQLQTNLNNKAGIRLDNVVNDLTSTEQNAFRIKIGAGTGTGSINTVGLSMPLGFTVSNSPLTGSGGTITVTLSTGYVLPTTTKTTQWDSAYTHVVNFGDVTKPVPDWSTQLTSMLNF